MTVHDIIEELNIHFKRIDALIPQIKEFLPLKADFWRSTLSVQRTVKDLSKSDR